MSQTEETKAIAAAKAGMSEKTARKYLKAGKLPSQMKKARTWRTRKDPFAEDWVAIERMLRVDGSLQAKTIFEYLCRTYPGRYEEGQLRTLQRKIKVWRGIEGPEKDVMFPQVRQAGAQCQSDYTCMNDLNITVAHQPFNHLLYHFVLAYSNWEWVSVCFSESLESLKKGLQDALWSLGGIPREHRTDNLSAAVNNLKDRKEFNRHYQEVMEHYGMESSRNYPGNAHENGDVEQSHYRLKMAIDQELRLRGSRDFDDREAYAAFLEEIVKRRNQNRHTRVEEEHKRLRPLPRKRLEDYSETEAVVSRFSTISVRKNVYSVDSRLIKEKVRVRLYAENLEIWYGGKKVETLPRLRGKGHHRVNYRHVIDSLVRKPGAFANYKYKQDLYPSFIFKLTYDRLQVDKPGEADREYTKILELAAKESEERVSQACHMLINKGELPTSAAVGSLVKESDLAPGYEVEEPSANLADYDGLLGGTHVP